MTRDSKVNKSTPKSFGKSRVATRHPPRQKMNLPAACASCALPTADESNHSAASTSTPRTQCHDDDIYRDSIAARDNFLVLQLVRPTAVLWPFVRTTWVSQCQKKQLGLPTHTYPDHQSSFSCFLHLLRSIGSSLFNLRARQSFCTPLSKCSLVVRQKIHQIRIWPTYRPKRSSSTSYHTGATK